MTRLLSLLLLLSLAAGAQTSDIEKALSQLPQVSWRKTADAPFAKYLLLIRQPLDHSDTAQGFFYQQATLTHKGFDKPMVMETEGYEMHTGGNEIEKILGANNLNVEHRYFGKSKPDSMQWRFLRYEQVVQDLHRINTILRTLYKGKWVSTGISRGGQTAIYYKSAYPGDIDLAVPYVAPVPNALEDRRIYTFLDTVGSDACRQKIFEVQRFLLEHEKEAVARLRWYALGKGLSFTYFGSLEKAFEMYVLEYPFSFWQIGSTPCEKIPVNRNVDDYLEHLLSGVGGIEFLSDKSVRDWVPNGYMARAQGGYYSYDLKRFRPYLRHYKGGNPAAALIPDGVPSPRFDSSFITRVHHWLATEGNGILYIYGSTDTWSACRVIPSAAVNSKSFLLPGANHYQARVKNMTPAMREEFLKELKGRLGME